MGRRVVRKSGAGGYQSGTSGDDWSAHQRAESRLGSRKWTARVQRVLGGDVTRPTQTRTQTVAVHDCRWAFGLVGRTRGAISSASRAEVLESPNYQRPGRDAEETSRGGPDSPVCDALCRDAG